MISLQSTPRYADHLPECAGVYLFYQHPDTLPVYIGKSINIKKRVQSHFYSAKRDPKEKKIIDNTQYIDFITTAGELGALLLEAQLVKDKMPIYNRKLRRNKSVYSFQLVEKANTLQPVLISQTTTAFQTDDCYYGLFRNQRRAWETLDKLITHHQLCKKTLGMEKMGKTCFAYQLKKCRGACAGIESIAEHNTRLQFALEAFRQQLWPFDNSIGIVERDGKHCDVHLINHWRYQQTLRHDSDGNKIDWQKDVTFDIDIYKILKQMIINNKNPLEIIRFPSNSDEVIFETIATAIQQS